jgi:hypothetical protein
VRYRRERVPLREIIHRQARATGKRAAGTAALPGSRWSASDWQASSRDGDAPRFDPGSQLPLMIGSCALAVSCGAPRFDPGSQLPWTELPLAAAMLGGIGVAGELCKNFHRFLRELIGFMRFHFGSSLFMCR